MTTFTKGQIVSFHQNGEVKSGKIDAIGSLLIGVQVKGGGYEALEKSKVIPQTPAQKAGLQIGDIVVVGVGIQCPHAFTVGEEATFEYDDNSQSPRFLQDGGLQYLNLNEITIGRKPVDDRTPSQKMGLKVGDTVKLLDQEYIRYFGSEYTKLMRDDGSEMPRFGDSQKSLWLRLSDIEKLPEGPKAGVKWSDAPIGSTHYSMRPNHGSKWHKLDTNGDYHFALHDAYKGAGFKRYEDQKMAYPATLVAIPGVTVEVVAANPLNAVLKEVKALEAQVISKTAQVETLNRDVARLNTEKQAKLDRIKAGGFKVEGDKLVKAGKLPAEWQDGDRVRCIKREGRGLANIIVGGVYKVAKRGNDVGIVDGDGDVMRGCVSSGCFEFVDAAPRVVLSSVSPDQWKAGDIVEAVEAGWDITEGKRYTVTGMCHASGPHVRFEDDVNFKRRRPVREFKLVARA